MSFSVERAMLDNWAAWLKRNRYQGGPKPLRNPIAAVADLGVPTGPVHYGDEIVDPDEEAVLVDRFMARTQESDPDAHAALAARHAREFTDTRGVRWVRVQLPERKIAVAMYGRGEEASLRMLRRRCDVGYEQLRRFKSAA